MTAVAMRQVAAVLANEPAREDCLPWPGPLDRHGYGRDKAGLAHRQVWQEFRGPLDPALEIDHVCNNKICVNPHHLEQVTRAENERRKIMRQFGYDPTVQCRRGHDRSPENVYVTSKGKKNCRPCLRQSARNSRLGRVA